MIISTQAAPAAAGFIALPGFLLALQCRRHPSLRCRPLLARGSLYHFPSDLCPAGCNLSFTPRLWIPPFPFITLRQDGLWLNRPPDQGHLVKFSLARLCGDRSHRPVPVAGCRGRVPPGCFSPQHPGGLARPTQAAVCVGTQPGLGWARSQQAVARGVGAELACGRWQPVSQHHWCPGEPLQRQINRSLSAHPFSQTKASRVPLGVPCSWSSTTQCQPLCPERGRGGDAGNGRSGGP